MPRRHSSFNDLMPLVLALLVLAAAISGIAVPVQESAPAPVEVSYQPPEAAGPDAAHAGPALNLVIYPF